MSQQRLGNSQFQKEEEKKDNQINDYEMKEVEEEDCYDEEQDQIQPLDMKINSSVPNIPKPKPAQGIKQQPGKFDPTPWNEFYDTKEKINDKIPIYYAGNKGHVFFCLHGAGHTALSFAALAQILKGPQFNSTCVSFDFRGHGEHFCDDETNMSQQILIDETILVLKHVINKYPNQSIIMVGHSMGGSIATKASDFILKNHSSEEWAGHIKGLFIIDVVEGSALDALPFMEQIASSRPSQFTNLQSVIKYGVSSGTVRDLKSAKVSMPAQVIQKNISGQDVWVWRTDLLGSKVHWVEWFTGLTKCFLDLRFPKQLLLAGNDRMDKELTIAHMQGKFKMVVVDNVGHVIQEDNPQSVATVFMQFLDKFHIPSAHAEQMVITTATGKKVVINR